MRGSLLIGSHFVACRKNGSRTHLRVRRALLPLFEIPAARDSIARGARRFARLFAASENVPSADFLFARASFAGAAPRLLFR